MAVEAKAGTAAHSLTLAMDHAQGRLCPGSGEKRP